MKIIKIVLNLYCLLITLPLLVVGFKNLNSFASLTLFLFLLPIALYLPVSLFGRLKKVKITLVVINFIFSLVILVVELLAVKNLVDGIFVFLFLPVFINFLMLLIQCFKKSPEKEVIEADAFATDTPAAIDTLIFEQEHLVQDETRRKFIKVIAGAGIGTIVLCLMNPQKAAAAFFGSMPGPGVISIKDSAGTKIDPSIKDPTDSYGISDTSETGVAHYYGFIHYNGSDWYILKDAGDGTFAYATKANNVGVAYATAWTNKASSLGYGSFSAAFKTI